MFFILCTDRSEKNGRQGSDGWMAAVATAVTVVSDATASDAAARPPDVVIIISHGQMIVNNNRAKNPQNQ